MPEPSENESFFSRENLVKTAIVVALALVVLIVVLALIGPAIGNVYSGDLLLL